MRKTEREILHCDMNNFFASVELLDHPELAGKPVAVCGKKEDRHGIVLAKNEAAKLCGIQTAQTIWQAQMKCPDLVILEPHYEKYVSASRAVRAILQEYTDLVEPFGIDECWLDVSASRRLFGNGEGIAEVLRRRIKKETGLTCSVGVSFNKVFAKLGSDLKKPDAVSLIPSSDFKEIVWPLPVGAMLGIGKRTEADLKRFGIDTLGKLASSRGDFLKLRYGKNGEWMKNAANGLDFSPVAPISFEIPIKSIGHGITTASDLTSDEEVWRVMLELCQRIGEKLRFHRKKAGGVAISLRDQNLFRKEFQKKLIAPTDSTMKLARSAFQLFQERFSFVKPLRSVTVRAISLLDENEGEQLSLFHQEDDLKEKKIEGTIDQLRARFGKNIIRNASLLTASAFFSGKAEEAVTTLPNGFHSASEQNSS